MEIILLRSVFEFKIEFCNERSQSNSVSTLAFAVRGPWEGLGGGGGWDALSPPPSTERFAPESLGYFGQP